MSKKCSVHTIPEKFGTQQSADFVVEENSGWKITCWLLQRYCLWRAPFPSVFHPHWNAELAFSNSYCFKNAFKKLCFQDRRQVVWIWPKSVYTSRLRACNQTSTGVESHIQVIRAWQQNMHCMVVKEIWKTVVIHKCNKVRQNGLLERSLQTTVWCSLTLRVESSKRRIFWLSILKLSKSNSSSLYISKNETRTENSQSWKTIKFHHLLISSQSIF